MTKVGMKNMLELFCVNTGMMQQSQNYTTLKIKRNRKNNHFGEEVATGQSFDLLFSGLGRKCMANMAWWKFEAFSTFNVIKIYLKHPRIDYLFRCEAYIRTSNTISELFDQTTLRRHPTLFPVSGLCLYQKMLYFIYLRKVIKYLLKF